MVVELALALALAMPALGLVLLALLAPGLALGLALLAPPLVLLALVPAGTRAQRLEQKRREPREASGLVRGWQQLPRLQGAVEAAGA